MTNHYNGATVWGTLDKFTRKVTENGKSYVEILINCPHNALGNVRILGRMWGKDVVEAFYRDVQNENIQKGVELRLEGNLQQYHKEDDIKTSFNFYRYEFGPLKEKKAAFRLVGEVQSFDDDTLGLRVVQDQKEDFEARCDDFEVVVPKILLLELPANPTAGQVVRVKGYMQMEEDEFGEAKENQRPVAKSVEIVET